MTAAGQQRISQLGEFGQEGNDGEDLLASRAHKAEVEWDPRLRETRVSLETKDKKRPRKCQGWRRRGDEKKN